MPFNRIATTAWMLCALLGFSSPLPAETIQFYFDSDTPQIAFAAGDIKAALEKQEHTVQVHDLARAYDEEESPHIKNRGIKFNIPLDKESPTYYYGHHGTSHKLAIKDVWDMGFWKTWFDEMARHRYNVLSLGSPHPFTSMVNMEDEYPGIAIQGVTGFDVSDEFFQRHLAARFTEVPADRLFEAWSSASGAIRRANEQVTGKWQFDADFWPEMWTGDMWDKKEGRHFSLDDTKEATPFSGSSLASLRETADGNVGEKISAWDNIEKVDALSTKALELLASLKPGGNVELPLTLRDLTTQARLGQFNAEKFRAVIYDIQGEKGKAKQAMGKAYSAWRRYTDLMDALYIGVDMQRNRSFSEWHDYDKIVLQDYLDLGGIGEPAWRQPE